MTAETPIEARKAEILRMGQNAVARRGARRRARWHTAAMVALTAGATVLAFSLAPTPIHPEGPFAHVTTLPASSITSSRITIERVATVQALARSLARTPDHASIARADASSLRITRVKTKAPAKRIGDTEALDLLREAGKPAGLIKVEGRVIVVYRDRPGPPGLRSEAIPFGSVRTLAALPPRR